MAWLHRFRRKVNTSLPNGLVASVSCFCLGHEGRGNFGKKSLLRCHGRNLRYTLCARAASPRRPPPPPPPNLKVGCWQPLLSIFLEPTFQPQGVEVLSVSISLFECSCNIEIGGWGWGGENGWVLRLYGAMRKSTHSDNFRNFVFPDYSSRLGTPEFLNTISFFGGRGM